jgi:hypothetical protein
MTEMLTMEMGAVILVRLRRGKILSDCVDILELTKVQLWAVCDSQT